MFEDTNVNSDAVKELTKSIRKTVKYLTKHIFSCKIYSINTLNFQVKLFFF